MNNKSINYFQNPQLDGGHLFHRGNRKVGVLLIHGFTATTVEVRILADHFIQKNYSVSTPLLPGHGTTPEDLNSRKLSEWTECVEVAYNQLRQRCDNVIVGGESMGAVLTLFLASKHPTIKAIYLFSPALLVKRLKFARFMQFTTPLMDKNQPEDDLAWQGYTVYPTRAAHQFYQLTRVVKKSLNRVISPAIMFQGKLDHSIDLNNIDFIHKNIGSTIKEKVWLINSGHVMLLDRETALIINKIEKFNQQIQISSDIHGL